MKNKIGRSLLSIIIILLSFACSKDDNRDGVSNKNATEFTAEELRCLSFINGNNRVPIETAKEEAMSFISSSKDNQTRSLSRSIKNIEVITNDKNIGTKSNSNGLDTLMYIVNFADNMGYVIVSSDIRTDNIFAYSTTGNININDGNWDPGSKMLFDNIGLMYDYQIQESNKLIDSLSNRALLKLGKTLGCKNITKADIPGYEVKYGKWVHNNEKGPLLKTTWFQGSPYNKYCPVIASKNTPAGCVAIAIGQIMAYHKTGPTGYDWSLIGNIYSSSDENKINEVARLIREIGVGVDMRYELGGSSSTDKKAKKYMENYLFISSHVDYYEPYISNSINENRPVYISGSSDEGHAWVLDGTVRRTRDVMLTYNGIVLDRHTEYLDCIHGNYGWGSSGYYSNGVYDYYGINEETGESIRKVFNKNLKIIHSIRPK